MLQGAPTRRKSGSQMRARIRTSWPVAGSGKTSLSASQTNVFHTRPTGRSFPTNTRALDRASLVVDAGVAPPEATRVPRPRAQTERGLVFLDRAPPGRRAFDRRERIRRR